jgi:hypothetical protein
VTLLPNEDTTMNGRPQSRILGLARLAFELVLVGAVIVCGIWITRLSKKTKPSPPIPDGITLTGDHIVVVKTRPTSEFERPLGLPSGFGGTPLTLTLRAGKLVDLLGHDSGLTDPRGLVQFTDHVGGYYFVQMQINDPNEISADELRHAISCITRAIPPGKKCYIEVFLF